MDANDRSNEKIQRLVEEYLGAAGSAAITTREGDVLFASSDEFGASMRQLARGARPETGIESMGNRLLFQDTGSCIFRVVIDERHVLLLFTENSILPSEATQRIKRALPALRLAFGEPGSPSASGAGGASGAPAQAFAQMPRKLG